MISVKRLVEYVQQQAKNGTSGYTRESEINNDIYAVQYDILGLLCDNYERSQKVTDALNGHVLAPKLTSNSLGIINLPENYYRSLSVLYQKDENNQYPAFKSNINGLGMSATSPIRKADLTKNRAGYYFLGNTIRVEPKQVLDIVLMYCKKPEEAYIKYTISEDTDNDYRVVDEVASKDIEFPEGLFNLFLYKMLERLGVECHEKLLIEIAALGIQTEIKTQIA